ncbi:hypothetical protein BT67DRAFT_454793 [Trichocladium antarcticum]|uniref:Uncharacterized protein n=1 Tax=Trichocladium antarcticum TaxID=1450529 RepID=A0AAN6UN04_9PEZI|nr:hypothetical protein BT67DRAFT_454793 [Trichocladium antarcticum]
MAGNRGVVDSLASIVFVPSFKRLVSILTEGDNTLPASPATNEQQENSATAAAAAAAALAALPDLEPDPIYKTNIAGLATTEQQEGSPAAAAAACKTIAKQQAPSATSKRKKKKKEDADELGLQIGLSAACFEYAKQGHTTKCKMPPESLYDKVRDYIRSMRKETAAAPAANPFFASPRAATYSTSLFLARATP